MPVRTARLTVVENWRRLYENSRRPGSLSHLLAKKVYNYTSNGNGTRTYAFTQEAWGNKLSVSAFTGDSWTTARNAGVWEHQTGYPFTHS